MKQTIMNLMAEIETNLNGQTFENVYHEVVVNEIWSAIDSNNRAALNNVITMLQDHLNGRPLLMKGK